MQPEPLLWQHCSWPAMQPSRYCVHAARIVCVHATYMYMYCATIVSALTPYYGCLDLAVVYLFVFEKGEIFHSSAKDNPEFRIQTTT